MTTFLLKIVENYILVNNWANGWVLDSEKLIIVFLPQYLEYLGFVFLIGTFVVILLKESPCFRKETPFASKEPFRLRQGFGGQVGDIRGDTAFASPPLR